MAGSGRGWGTALPRIVADLEGFERYAWVTTSYLLASTAVIPVVGKLGDVYGRKWFIVGDAVVFLVGAALLMKNLKLEDPATLAPEEAALAGDPVLTATLAAALGTDATGDEDRIETGNGGYPALIHAAAGLSGDHEGDERERAVHASKTVIRPLAERETDAPG